MTAVSSDPRAEREAGGTTTTAVPPIPEVGEQDRLQRLTRSGPAIVGWETDDYPLVPITAVVQLHNGCLLLATVATSDSEQTVVIWPYGSTWDEAAKGVRLPSGHTTGIGDEFSATAGFFTADPAHLPSQVAECVGDTVDEVAFVQLWPDEN